MQANDFSQLLTGHPFALVNPEIDDILPEQFNAKRVDYILTDLMDAMQKVIQEFRDSDPSIRVENIVYNRIADALATHINDVTIQEAGYLLTHTGMMVGIASNRIDDSRRSQQINDSWLPEYNEQYCCVPSLLTASANNNQIHQFQPKIFSWISPLVFEWLETKEGKTQEPPMKWLYTRIRSRLLDELYMPPNESMQRGLLFLIGNAMGQAIHLIEQQQQIEKSKQVARESALKKRSQMVFSDGYDKPHDTRSLLPEYIMAQASSEDEFATHLDTMYDLTAGTSNVILSIIRDSTNKMVNTFADKLAKDLNPAVPGYPDFYRQCRQDLVTNLPVMSWAESQVAVSLMTGGIYHAISHVRSIVTQQNMRGLMGGGGQFIVR